MDKTLYSEMGSQEKDAIRRYVYELEELHGLDAYIKAAEFERRLKKKKEEIAVEDCKGGWG